jgi:hypothetical protein
MFSYEPWHGDILVRLPSDLVVGRIVVWPDKAYFVPNSGRTFTTDELLEVIAKLKEMKP